MLKALITIAAMATATPALAGPVYGPVEPKPPAREWSPEDQRTRKQAKRAEIAFQALSVVDAAQTCYVISTGRGVEANPLVVAVVGKRPKCSVIFGSKSVVGVVHWAVFDHLNNRNPKAAKVFSLVSLGAMGGVVVANLRVVF